MNNSDMLQQHKISLMRFIRGRDPLTSRLTYGYDIRCSCGFKQQVNGTKREAQAKARLHVTASNTP